MTASTSTDQEASRRARLTLVGGILTTYGYAIAGVSLLQPFFASAPEPLTPVRISGFAFALAIQSVAIYIAPKGEKP